MFLPVAQIHVNIISVILMGLSTGFIGSLFGVGSSFILIPVLMKFGLSNAMAIGCATNQMLGTSAGVFIYFWIKQATNTKVAIATITGTIIGLTIGSNLYKYLNEIEKIELATIFIYIFVLGTTAVFMMQESISSIRSRKNPLEYTEDKDGKFKLLINSLPLKIQISPNNEASVLVPFFSGFIASIITLISGLSGSFVLIPVFVYILKMPIINAIATSNFNGFISLIISTIIHSVISKSIDIFLTIPLLIGATFGSQLGVQISQKIPPEELRLSLSIIMSLLIINFACKLFFAPSNIFSITAA